jgi:predicted MFS family arabinose efflux permease
VQLGNLTLARALVQALASPLAGVAAALAPRGRVIGAGCALWATFTAAFACAHSVGGAMPAAAVNGIGLALVIPAVQSLTADLTPAEGRGRAFGRLWLTISLGGGAGALLAVNLGRHDFFGGALPGWRAAFFLVATLSFTTGVLNALYVVDPAWAAAGRAAGGRSQLSGATLRRLAGEMAAVARVPTFCIIVAQGIVGSVPYAALVFLTLYLQLAGLSDGAAAAVTAAFLVGGGLGGLLGGRVGDAAAARWPAHGRLAATQLSVASGIPFAVAIFRGLPLGPGPGPAAAHGAAAFLFALLSSWAAPCFNNPAFAEVVPARSRTLVYSFDRAFEGAVAAFATPLVGRAAERAFGFSGAATPSGDAALDRANAAALGSALLAFCVVPWAICLVAYSALHWTYPRDWRRAAARDKGGDEAGGAGPRAGGGEGAPLLPGGGGGAHRSGS